MSRQASFPMYLYPHTKEAWGALWSAIADALSEQECDAPDHLSEPDNLWVHWTDPDLLLSQTCSFPFRDKLHPHVTVLGAWDLGLKGCPPGHYNSVLVRRRGEARPWQELLRTGCVAVNALDSQSGHQVLADLLGKAPAIGDLTGSHHASVTAVRKRKADIAAIDAESWRLIVEAEGGALGVEVCHRTEPTPGLPLITAKGRDTEKIRSAIAQAVQTMDRITLATLHIRGFVPLTDADYLAAVA